MAEHKQYHVRYTCGSQQLEGHFRVRVNQDNQANIVDAVQAQIDKEGLAPMSETLTVAQRGRLLIVALPCKALRAGQYLGKQLRQSRTARFMAAVLAGTTALLGGMVIWKMSAKGKMKTVPKAQSSQIHEAQSQETKSAAQTPPVHKQPEVRTEQQALSERPSKSGLEQTTSEQETETTPAHQVSVEAEVVPEQKRALPERPAELELERTTEKRTKTQKKRRQKPEKRTKTRDLPIAMPEHTTSETPAWPAEFQPQPPLNLPTIKHPKDNRKVWRLRSEAAPGGIAWQLFAPGETIGIYVRRDENGTLLIFNPSLERLQQALRDFTWAGQNVSVVRVRSNVVPLLHWLGKNGFTNVNKDPTCFQKSIL